MVADAATVPDHIEHRIPLPDGRVFAAAEWGDPDGIPLISIHGTPGGRMSWWQDPDIYRRYGLRRITIDRPGYGESSRLRGRRVADIIPDLEPLTEALGIDRFVVTGGSGGGPHALACAALLPDRVIRCLAQVSIAPYGIADMDWLDGMTEGNVIEFSAALEGEPATRKLLHGLRTETLERLAAGRLDWMGDDYELSPADQAQMAKHHDRIAAQLTSCLEPGIDGWVDDDIAFTKPWGFDVEDIRVPVVISYGRTDALVPPAHGDWLAAHVPGAIAWVDEEAGHGGDDSQIEREYAWLATGRDTADGDAPTDG